MIVKTIIDNENGKKWEIIKLGKIKGYPFEVYTCNYYERCHDGWIMIYNGEKSKTEWCSKEFIEEDFNIKIA